MFLHRLGIHIGQRFKYRPDGVMVRYCARCDRELEAYPSGGPWGATDPDEGI